LESIKNSLIADYQVRITFKQLHDHLLEFFIENKINPEIAFDTDDFEPQQ